MSKFKKIYRDFFKLNEQDSSIPKITDQDVENAEKYAAALKSLDETELEEAQLINKLSDYNGHVIYQLRDPQEANSVAKEIQRWTTKKGFTIITHKNHLLVVLVIFIFDLEKIQDLNHKKFKVTLHNCQNY